MSTEQKICMSCMDPVPADAAVCPNCGFDGGRQNPEIFLTIGYRLGGRYVVGRVQDSDGDSATYAGYDMSLGKRVEIREFLPVNGCGRNRETGALLPKSGAELHYKTALMDFSDLFRNLHKLTYEEGIVKTLDFFECNQTAYAVLEYFDGVTLREFLGLKNGVISWDQCGTIMNPVFGALCSIHGVNLTHRGVSPETILISRSGEIKLSGFATTSVRTRGTEVAAKLFSGYSAPEQYATAMWQSTATDVYGLAATIYRCITGTVPQDADQRRMYDSLAAPSELAVTLPAHVSKAIMLAMLIDQNERVKTVLGFRQLLSGAGEPDAPAEERAEPDADLPERFPAAERNGGKERLLKGLAVAAASLFALMLIVYFVRAAVLEKQSAGGNPPAVENNYFKVPDFSGLTLEEAEKKYDTSRFYYVIETAYFPDEPEGIIVSHNPAANASIHLHDTITLYFNQSRTVEMIDFKGLTKENAEQKLRQLGIESANYKLESEETAEGYDGTVFRQSAEPGAPFNINKDLLVLTIAMRPAAAENP